MFVESRNDEYKGWREFPDGCASYPLHRRILTGSNLMKCDDRISEKRYNDFMKSEAGGNIHENCDY